MLRLWSWTLSFLHFSCDQIPISKCECAEEGEADKWISPPHIQVPRLWRQISVVSCCVDTVHGFDAGQSRESNLPQLTVAVSMECVCIWLPLSPLRLSATPVSWTTATTGGGWTCSRWRSRAPWMTSLRPLKWQEPSLLQVCGTSLNSGSSWVACCTQGCTGCSVQRLGTSFTHKRLEVYYYMYSC